jgi:hypothetical protein
MVTDPTVWLKAAPVVVLLILILFIGSGKSPRVMNHPTPTPMPTPIVTDTPVIYLRCVEQFEHDEKIYYCTQDRTRQGSE